MVRQYVQVTDQQRSQLVKLIHEQNYSIARASKATNIPYDNAKAINRTYTREQRVQKINYKQRYQTRRLNHKGVQDKLKDMDLLEDYAYSPDISNS